MTANSRRADRRPPRPKRRPVARAREYEVTAALRQTLHEVEEKIGLFAPGEGFGAGGRFRAPRLLGGEEPIPAAMGKFFREPLAALGRVGKSSVSCHAVRLGPFTVYCLPYYFFDGFNALVFVEKEGQMMAAWREQELHPAGTPRTLTTRTPYADLREFFGQLLGAAAEG